MSEGAADRLDSWKDIALFLKRDVSTVQRWEKREGMPVHRHQHDKGGSVYAYKSELGAWLDTRRPEPEVTPSATPIDGSSNQQPPPPRPAGSGEASATKETFAEASSWIGRRRIASILAALVLLAGYVAWSGTGGVSTPPEVRSLVVLPLQNLSGDTGQDFFADGLTEELTSRLARLKELRIVSRTSAMTYRGRSRALPEIARDLDVDAVIEGSVRRDGDRVRISVQLVHGPSDTHLWAREYDARLVDLLDLQTQVARDVARELRVRTTSQTAVKTDRDVDPSAYEAYLRGRFHLWKFTESDRVQALEYFQRALDIDPDYAPAWAGIAHTWWARGVFGPMTLTEVAEPARAAATRALLLDDSLPEAHAHMAYLQGMFDWRWQEAEATVRRAVTLGPNSVDASYVYAVLLMALGRRAEAIEWADRAVRLDPLSAVTHSMAGRTRYRARQFAEAVAPLRRAIELEPANPLSIQRLGDVYLQMGRYSEAQALYAKAAGLGVEADGRRALLYARMGRRDEAQAILRQVPPEKRWPTVVVALGDHDGAFDLLFKAIDSRSESLLYIKDDPLYQPLHTDVRWPHLLERMNLQ